MPPDSVIFALHGAASGPERVAMAGGGVMDGRAVSRRCDGFFVGRGQGIRALAARGH